MLSRPAHIPGELHLDFDRDKVAFFLVECHVIIIMKYRRIFNAGAPQI